MSAEGLYAALIAQHSSLSTLHEDHQILQIFLFTIGALSPHLKAFLNSGRFETTPLMRYLPGECGLVIAFTRRFSGRSFSQAHCARPMKNRWSGVKPSTGSSCSLATASFQAM